MRCAQCDSSVLEGSRYCGFCGVNFVLTGLAWALRRALGGGLIAAAGWIFIRLTFLREAPEVPSMMHFCLEGILIGFFLGIPGGILERRPRLALSGAVGGIAGGILGGILSFWVLSSNLPFLTPQNRRLASDTLLWGLLGMGVGAGFLSSKILGGASGMLAGIVGGLVGGQLAIASGITKLTLLWTGGGVSEAFAGFVVGGFLWAALALAQRFSPEGLREAGSTLLCKVCRAENFSKNRYCTQCGLPMSGGSRLAPKRYGALRRFTGGFRFLGRLSLILGTLSTLGLFGLYIFKDVLIAFVASLACALFAYLLFVSLNAASEIIHLFLDIEENTRKR